MNVKKLALRMALLAAPLLAALLWCGTASAAVINATFDSGYDVDGGIRKTCAQAAIDQWEATITSDITFANAVSFRITNMSTQGNPLAATSIASGGYSSLMAEGEWIPSVPGGGSGDGGVTAIKPWGSSTYVTITLNSVFVDQMFFGGPADPVSGSNEYDALTIFRHELAHAVGFSAAYTDFAAKLSGIEPNADRTYTGSDFTALITGANYGTHIPNATTDLMNAGLGKEVRKDISADPDLKILMDAYNGYTPEPATLAMVAVGLAGALAARRRRAAA